MDKLEVKCPLCGGNMTMAVDLMAESVNFFCSCVQYTNQEDTYITEVFRKIDAQTP